MSDVIDAIGKLREHAEELDGLSKALHLVEQELEPVQDAYDIWVDAFDVGLWVKHTDGGEKLPPAAMRTKLAHKQMDPVLLGRYVGLHRKRDELMRQIGIVKAMVDAQRSILSALKTEMEASSHR